VVYELGDKIDFNVEFVHYAMHGKTELDEQAKQVCMMEADEKKYYSYLECFLDKGDSGAEQCLVDAGFDAGELDTCIAELDQEFGITAGFEDQSTWLGGSYPQFKVHQDLAELYGVGGSPTLVINGAIVNSGRSPAEYLSTLCAAFNDAPEECEVLLTTESFSPGFGYQGTGGAEASCGS